MAKEHRTPGNPASENKSTTRWPYWALLIVAIALLLGPGAAIVHGQGDYMGAIGVPTFTTALPIENGFINLANGNMHLEIPLGSWPQRGGRNFTAALMYDSASAEPYYSSYHYIPNSIGVGWHLAHSADSGNIDVPEYQTYYCDYPYEDEVYRMDSRYAVWAGPDGTSRVFNVSVINIYSTNCSGPANFTVEDPGGYATDGSGYHLHIANDWTMTILAPDGDLPPVSAHVIIRLPGLAATRR